ncbi:hypothetical protein Pelo_7844 [Pelomyxa schiedti]|nr:hypothetical protein Pelo_7844 [Pelomyxa schiedti]
MTRVTWWGCVVIGMVVFAVARMTCGTVGERLAVDIDEMKGMVQGLHVSCSETCSMRLKSDQACDSFCTFVDHIWEDHIVELYDLWLGAKKSLEVMNWAMEDTVNWRVRSRVEDYETSAKYFLTKCNFWVEYTNMKEL